MGAQARRAGATRSWLRFSLAVVVGAASAVTLSACAQPGTASGGRASSPAETEGDAVNDLLGSWSADETGKPRLAFDANGGGNGSDGCNGIATSYRLQDDRVQLAPFISTLKACAGVNDWLRGVREVAVQGDTLRVFDASGQEIGQLRREA